MIWYIGAEIFIGIYIHIVKMYMYTKNVTKFVLTKKSHFIPLCIKLFSTLHLRITLKCWIQNYTCFLYWSFFKCTSLLYTVFFSATYGFMNSDFVHRWPLFFHVSAMYEFCLKKIKYLIHWFIEGTGHSGYVPIIKTNDNQEERHLYYTPSGL